MAPLTIPFLIFSLALTTLCHAKLQKNQTCFFGRLEASLIGLTLVPKPSANANSTSSIFRNQIFLVNNCTEKSRNLGLSFTDDKTEIFYALEFIPTFPDPAYKYRLKLSGGLTTTNGSHVPALDIVPKMLGIFPLSKPAQCSNYILTKKIDKFNKVGTLKIKFNDLSFELRNTTVGQFNPTNPFNFNNGDRIPACDFENSSTPKPNATTTAAPANPAATTTKKPNSAANAKVGYIIIISILFSVFKCF